MKTLRPIIAFLCLSASCLVSGCKILNKVSKNEFLESFNLAPHKDPVYRRIAGAVKKDGERSLSLTFIYENPEKTEAEERLAYFYDLVRNNITEYIDDAYSYYCNKGFKISRGLDVIEWDEYGNITTIIIKDVDEDRDRTLLSYVTVDTSIDLIITNTYE